MARIDWIDRAKGLGITTVVFAHVVAGPVSQIFYWFHMPLFFILSGYVFKPAGSTGAYAKRRAEQLLVPYACWTLIFTLFLAMKALRTGDSARVGELLKNALYGGPLLQGMMGVFWFSTCLYLALVAYHALHRVPRLSWILVGLYGLALVRSYFLPTDFPWAADACLIALPCIHLGACARKGEWAERQWALGLLALGFSIAAVAHFAGYRLPPVDIKNAKYGLPIVGAVLAIAGTALTVLLAQRLPKGFLEYVGRASLLVMFLHQAVHLTLGRMPDPVQFVAALGVPLALYPVLRHFKLTRRLLLGEPPQRKPNDDPSSGGGQVSLIIQPISSTPSGVKAEPPNPLNLRMHSESVSTALR